MSNSLESINIDFIKDGGWHFTCIKKPEDLHYKLSNFLHHVEYQESGIQIDKIKKLVKEKKILYDHNADMRDKKYTGKTNLLKVSNEILPNYIVSNANKYKEWLD